MKNPLEGGKISAYQLGLLMITTIIATGILYVPAITAEKAGHDGWISVLLVATIPGIVVVEICIALARRFPGQTLVEYSETILGKYFGKVVSFLFIFFLLVINATIIREFSTFVAQAFLIETPIVVIIGALMLLAVFMVRNGIEVISRINQFTIILFFIAFIFIVLLVAPNIDINNLLPLIDKGYKGVILGGLAPGGWRGEIVLIAMLFPFLNIPKQSRKACYGTVFAVGVLLAIDTISAVGVLGHIVDNEVFPVLAITQYISLAKFIERLEAVLVMFWVSQVLIKVAVFYYAAVLGAAQWFNLSDYRPIVLPIGIILTVWSITIFERTSDMVDFLSTTFVPWAYSHEILLPLFLLVVALITGKGAAKKK